MTVTLREHHCHAVNCVTNCPPEYLMCGRHWRMVPKALQREVWYTYQPGQCDWNDTVRPSMEWHVAADMAIAAVARKEGHEAQAVRYERKAERFRCYIRARSLKPGEPHIPDVTRPACYMEHEGEA